MLNKNENFSGYYKGYTKISIEAFFIEYPEISLFSRIGIGVYFLLGSWIEYFTLGR